MEVDPDGFWGQSQSERRARTEGGEEKLGGNQRRGVGRRSRRRIKRRKGGGKRGGGEPSKGQSKATRNKEGGPGQRRTDRQTRKSHSYSLIAFKKNTNDNSEFRVVFVHCLVYPSDP